MGQWNSTRVNRCLGVSTFVCTLLLVPKHFHRFLCEYITFKGPIKLTLDLQEQYIPQAYWCVYICVPCNQSLVAQHFHKCLCEHVTFHGTNKADSWPSKNIYPSHIWFFLEKQNEVLNLGDEEHLLTKNLEFKLIQLKPKFWPHIRIKTPTSIFKTTYLRSNFEKIIILFHPLSQVIGNLSRLQRAKYISYFWSTLIST